MTLKPSNLHLQGVSSVPVHILGIVCLPINLGKRTATVYLDFYVVSDFSLPSDGLIGLRSMKTHSISIHPNKDTVRFQGKHFVAMKQPSRLLLPYRDKGTTPKQIKQQSISPALSTDVKVVSSVSITPRTQNKRTEETNKHNNDTWSVVKATVIGTHVIPSRTAVHIPVNVPKSTVSCDILIEGPSQINNLIVEPTLNKVREGHKTTALVVNTTSNMIKLKQGVFLSQALAYDKQVDPEPAEIPKACIASVKTPKYGDEKLTQPTLESLIKIHDYPELKQPLINLLNHFRDVVALPGEPLGKTHMTEHHIKLKPNTNPVYIPAYRLPHSQREIVDKQIEELLAQGVINHSKSPWNSPLFLVPKKDGTYRPVIDFRQVNNVTEDDRYPLPVLKDLLMSLGHGNKFFSSLDLLSGYWQVPMAPSSKAVTAFSTPSGHYHWERMPFGLKSAGITFQRFINTLFAGIIGKHVYAYLDDLIIFSKDADSHLASLELVLLKLREAGLKAKLSKCDFLQKSVIFLGHKVDADGIHTLDTKIQAVKNFPQPKSIENVRSFLGLCSYYRSFVKGFSNIASPLNKLLKKGTVFHWNVAQEQSFQKLKQALINSPILAFPNYAEPFILYTDASSLGLGAVLMQTEEDGKNRAIAYASRSLSEAESNYSVTHQETLAVVWALKTFRDIIYGYPITCYTDHAPVRDLFKGRNLTGRLARWYLTILEFEPTFKYLPGRANTVADSLSRNIQVGALTEQTETLNNFSIPELIRAQRQHPIWGKLVYHLESGDEISLPTLHIPLSQFFLDRDGVLRRYWPNKRSPANQFVIPEEYVNIILQKLHDTPIAGHPGKERTLAAARVTYYWPTMRVDIDKHVDQCLKCAQNKGNLPKPAPILEYPPPTRPWDVVGMDLLQLPQSRQESKYLLVCVDHFSRYVVLAPLKDKTAGAIAHALITKLFHVYSTPRVLLSDNAAEFRSTLLNKICSQYNIKQTFVTAYHPASNGLVERANRKILEVLRPVVSNLLDSWEDWLSQVALSINSNVCESTGHSPHYIVFGEEIRLPYDLLTSSHSPVYDVDDYAKCQRKVFSDIHQDVVKRLQLSKDCMTEKQHKKATPVTFKVGDTVMVKVPERRSKLSAKFVGPRLIVTKLQGNKFEVLDPSLNTLEIIHSDRLKRTQVEIDCNLGEASPITNATRLTPAPSNTPSNTPTHTYNLRKRN